MSGSTETLITTCGCISCLSDVNTDYFNNNQQGFSALDSPSSTATIDEFAEYLTDGFWHDFIGGSSGGSWATADYQGWTDTSITYSTTSYYSPQEQAGIDAAFQTWSDVTNLTFTKVSSGGQIEFTGPQNASENGRAFAANSWTNDGSVVNITGSRIMMDYDSGGFGSNPLDWGDYALTTAIHEIGHALGLGHSGNYNGSSASYSDAQWTNDTRQYSLMSYWSASNSGATHYEYPATPMLMDIAAIQNLYGVNNSTRSGDTTYGFNSNAGRNWYDFEINDHPVVAIWDGGGTDTIDLSGWSMDQMINLNDGEFSNAGWSAGNLAIARGAIIENAVGGGGADTIYGNEHDNVISGGAGNDLFYGSAGDDTLDGEGGGNDRLSYEFDIGDFLITLVDSVTLSFEHIAQAWTDTVTGIENFIFNGTDYTLAEVENSIVPDDPMRAQVFWGGNKHTEWLDGDANTTVTSTDMGYGGGSGNMFTVTRTGTNLDLDVLSVDAPDFFQLRGNDLANAITAQVAATDQGVVVYAAGGDDEVTMTGFSADNLYGEDGNDTLRGAAGADDLYGGEGNDILYGDNQRDDLYGGAGEDTLHGGSDNDRLYGGEDNDTLNGDGGSDRLEGQGGDDILNGGSGHDWMSGGSGDDTMNGGTHNDTLHGLAGNDIMNGGDGYDEMYGGDGNDTMDGGNQVDRLYGQGGADILRGGASTDRLYGDYFTGSETFGDVSLLGDELYGEGGDDFLYGHLGDDTLEGGDGFDWLYGGEGNDTMDGGADNDRLFGGDGADIMRGGEGNDRLYGDLVDGSEGYTNDDTLYGDAGDDWLWGHNGNDRLEGGSGIDRLFGNDGSDTLIGGENYDVLEGGAGADVFGIMFADGQRDAITDFTLGGAEGDAINITDILSGFTEGVDDADNFIDLVYWNSNRSELYVNSDGSGSDWVHVASIRGADFAGNTVDMLLSNNTIITDQSLA